MKAAFPTFVPLTLTQRNELLAALMGNVEMDHAILTDRRDTSFAGVSEDVTDDEVICAIRSVPTHYAIRLGVQARDKVTGFKGTVTGYVQYLSGCNQALLVPQVKEDGSMIEAAWFDEQRLSILPGDPLVLENGVNPGMDAPAPKR